LSQALSASVVVPSVQVIVTAAVGCVVPVHVEGNSAYRDKVDSLLLVSNQEFGTLLKTFTTMKAQEMFFLGYDIV
jgi:hypothetical protein